MNTVSGSKHFSRLNNFRAFHFLWLILIFHVSSTCYADVVFIEEKTDTYNIGYNFEILEDKNREYTIQEIITPGLNSRFTPYGKKAPNFGYTSSAIWARFKIDINNEYEGSDNWFLEIANPLLDYITLFIPQKDGSFIIKQSGDLLKFREREIKHRNFLFSIPAASMKGSFYYLRVETQGTLTFPTYLQSSIAFLKKDHDEQYALGIYYGIILVMIFYNLFLFFSLLDRTYLYYVFFIFSYGMFQIIMNGMAFEYLWPAFPWWANKALPFFIAFTLPWMILFSKKFLIIKDNLPKTNIVLNVLTTASIIVSVICLIAPYAVCVKLSTLLAFITIITIVICCILRLKMKYRPARLFLIAWSTFFGGILISIIRGWGFLPNNFFTLYGSQIGSAGIVIILSFALADRINIIKKEKEEAQADLVKTQQESLENLKKETNHRRILENQLQQAQKMEAIGTLAGGIAHDFNNILSSIIGYTELVMEDVIEKKIQHRNLTAVLTASERAKELVDQILTFSRQNRNELKPIKIKLIIKEVLQLLRATLPATITIKNRIYSESLIMGEPVQIHQIMMNLCTNSSHAMEEGVGELEIGLFDETIDDNFAGLHPEIEAGKYIKLSINDNGCGMSTDILKRAFDPFFTTKKQGEGTGMGLSVVHGIVKGHNGMILAKSESGVGSLFEIYFPMLPPAIELEKSEDLPVPTGTESILYVDDEASITDMAKQTLESLGYKVTTSTDSIQALELFKSGQDEFDIVITDMTMPNMTGDQLAKEIMNLKFNMPVILCCGYSTKIDEERAKEIGIKAFISKPIRKRKIAEITRDILDSSMA